MSRVGMLHGKIRYFTPCAYLGLCIISSIRASYWTVPRTSKLHAVQSGTGYAIAVLQSIGGYVARLLTDLEKPASESANDIMT